MALTAFRRAYMAEETTAGTKPSTGFKLLLGQMSVDRADRVHTPQDDFPSLAQNRRSFVVDTSTTLSYQVDATYAILDDFLRVGFTVQTGSDADTPATGFTRRDYKPAMDSPSSLKTVSVEFGDEAEQFVSSYAAARSLEFNIAQAGPCAMRVDMFGQAMTHASSFTSATAGGHTDETPIIADGFKIQKRVSAKEIPTAFRSSTPATGDLTWDGDWATIDNTVTNGTVRINSGLEMSRYLDGLVGGRPSYTGTNQMKRTHNFDLDLIMNSEGKKFFEDFADSEEKQVERWYRFQNKSGNYEFTIYAYCAVTQTSGFYQDVSGENGFRASLETREPNPSTLADLIIVTTTKD